MDTSQIMAITAATLMGMIILLPAAMLLKAT